MSLAPRTAKRGRLRVAALASFSALALGCGEAQPVARFPGETPEQAAARVFAVAEGLEKEHKSKQAFAAYHQVARQFPDTPEGKKAAERIRRAQRKAAIRPKSRPQSAGRRPSSR